MRRYPTLKAAVLVLGCSVWAAAAPTSAGESETRTVFKSVDEKGRVVFSDSVPAGTEANEVTVEAANAFDPQEAIPEELVELRAEEAAAREAAREAEAFEYRVLEILSPAEDEAVRANDGVMRVEVRSVPGLRGGHRFRLRLDGVAVAEGRNRVLVLPNVDRGTHVLELDVLDASRKVLQEAEPRVFHLLRYAIGTSPNPPGPGPVPLPLPVP